MMIPCKDVTTLEVKSSNVPQILSIILQMCVDLCDILGVYCLQI